jgi:hypothetical protein
VVVTKINCEAASERFFAGGCSWKIIRARKVFVGLNIGVAEVQKLEGWCVIKVVVALGERDGSPSCLASDYSSERLFNVSRSRHSSNGNRLQCANTAIEKETSE